jgi:hypothetical protein
VEKKRRWGPYIHQLRASSFGSESLIRKTASLFGSESLVRKTAFLIVFAHKKAGQRERRGRS